MSITRTRPRGFEPLEARALLSVGPRWMQRPAGHSEISAREAGSAHAQTLRNIAYPSADGRSGSLDVLLPAGQAPAGGWPVVLAIHGGGWRRFSKEEYEPTVAPLTRSGFAVVAIDYTLSSPGSPSWPAAIQDVNAALAWIRSSGASLGLDPDRVAAMGESAGGNLASLLGTETAGKTSGLSAVVDFFGPSDLAALDSQSRLAAPAVEQFLGGTPDQFPAAYAAASPALQVASDDPPFLIVQGTADPIVPEAQSIELSSNLSEAGVPNHLILVPGLGHGFGLHAGGLDLESSVVSFLREAFSTSLGSSQTNRIAPG